MRQQHNAHPSLVDRVTTRENNRHSGRIAEIKRMEKKLIAFEPIFHAMEERKVSLALESFRIYDDTLSIDGGLLTDWNVSRYDALTDLGFIEYERFTSSHYATCKLKKGRIRVSIMIPAHHQAGAS